MNLNNFVPLSLCAHTVQITYEIMNFALRFVDIFFALMLKDPTLHSLPISFATAKPDVVEANFILFYFYKNICSFVYLNFCSNMCKLILHVMTLAGTTWRDKRCC